MLIKNGPLIPVKVNGEGKAIKKKPEEFDSTDYKMMEKNAKAKKLPYFDLVQINTLEFQSMNQLRIFGMLSWWHMKAQIR